jgi:hypothetical protein
MSAAGGDARPDTVQDGGHGAEPRRRGERLFALFVGACVALNFPLLSLFLDATLVLGLPSLYLYLFSVWALVIVVAALVLRGRRPGPPDRADKEGAG